MPRVPGVEAGLVCVVQTPGDLARAAAIPRRGYDWLYYYTQFCISIITSDIKCNRSICIRNRILINNRVRIIRVSGFGITPGVLQ